MLWFYKVNHSIALQNLSGFCLSHMYTGQHLAKNLLNFWIWKKFPMQSNNSADEKEKKGK